MSYDYALIQINQTSIEDIEYIFSRAANISETPATLSEIVRRISLGEKKKMDLFAFFSSIIFLEDFKYI